MKQIKMIQKIIAAILVLMLCFSMLTGCGSDKENSGAADPGQADPETPALSSAGNAADDATGMAAGYTAKYLQLTDLPLTAALENGVAAGVRRIEAVTGRGVIALLNEKDAVIAETAKALKAGSPADMPVRASALNGEISRQKKEIEALNQKIAASRADSLLTGAVQVGSVRLVAADLGSAGMDSARALCDSFKDKYADMVVVLAVTTGDKLNFVGAAGPDAVKAGAHAGKLLGAVAAVTGGKGGGRPDSATSGGKDASKVAEALAQAKDILAGMLK